MKEKGEILSNFIENKKKIKEKVKKGGGHSMPQAPVNCEYKTIYQIKVDSY